MLAIAATGGFGWSASAYLYDVRHAGLGRWNTVKLAVVHYLTNVAFTLASFVGALRYKVILIPSSIFRPSDPN